MRTRILGCSVDNLNMEETLARIERFIASGRPHQHVVVNADKVVKAHANPKLREIINRCDLINADGMPVVWASYILGRPLKERVTGIDLFFHLMERAAERGWRVYLLGAREHVVQEVRRRLVAKHPGLTIAGARNGYWRPEEESEVARQVREARPDVLCVALSSPQKEEFLGRQQAYMRVPFAMGVGGTFDIAAGQVSRAPRFMQKAGLEWFYRFLQEPRRMFWRYFIEDMAFFWLLARERFAPRTRER
jgi:N-acetylglucosaminyldiphosphoundecaprenol N-acetyl-beta-D-mannosaminyltransferase